MITLKDFMEAIQYKVTDGSEYGWKCFGPFARTLDFWSGSNDDGVSVTAVFDSDNQEVYEMQAWDYSNKNYYRWLNPDFINDLRAEHTARNIPFEVCCDGINFIDLEDPSDILKKAAALVAGEEVDPRVTITLNLDEELLFAVMKLAHEADVTLNEYINQVLRAEIDRVTAEV